MTDNPLHPGPAAAGPGWFVAASALFVGMHLWQFDRYPVDGDELFSLTAAQKDWPGLVRQVAFDFSHPSLSYILLKLWIGIGGDGFGWLKLLPTLFGLLTLVPVLLAARELGLRPPEAAVAVALIGSCVFLLQLVHWVRMYAEAHFFAAWGVYFLAGAVSRGRLTWGWWAGWFVTSLGMVYSHYWGFVTLAAEFAALLLLARRHLLRFVSMGLLVAVGFAPWVWAIFAARGQTGTMTAQVDWIPKPTPMDVVYLWDFVNGRHPFPHSTKVGVALFGGVIAAYALTRPRSADARRLLGVCLPLVVVPVLLTYFASLVQKQSVFQARTMVSVVVPYFLLVAASACRLPSPPVRVFAVLAALAWGIGSAVAYKLGPDQKPRWDVVVSRIEREEPGDGPVRLQVVNQHFADLIHFHDTRSGGRRLDIAPGLVPDDRPPRFWALDTRTGDAASEPAAVIVEQYRAAGYVVGDGFPIPVARYDWRAYPVWRADPGP